MASETDPVPSLDWRAFLLIFVAMFLIATLSVFPGSVHHDAAEIYMWSRLGWPLTLPKHPPLLPWLFRVWFDIWPTSWLSMNALAALNVTAGAVAIWRIAVIEIGKPRALLAMVFYGMLPFATILPLKLNHNAILVSLWPLAMLAFFAILRRPTLARGTLLGLAVAAIVLAKYYSLVLLGAFVVATVATAAGRAALRTPAPYSAAVLFVAVLAPHVWAETNAASFAVEYAFRATGGPKVDTGRFVLGNVLMLLPMVLAGEWFRRTMFGVPVAGRAEFARLARDKPELALLAALPFLMTLVAAVSFNVFASVNWMVPAWSILAILSAALFPVPTAAQARSILRFGAAVLTAGVLVSPFGQYFDFRAHLNDPLEPIETVADVAAGLWTASVAAPLVTVGGIAGPPGAIAFRHPSHPLVWTDFNFAAAPWMNPAKLMAGGGLFICRDDVGPCDFLIFKAVPDAQLAECAVKLRRTLLWLQGPLVPYRITVMPPAGRLDDAGAFARACQQVGGIPGRTR